MPKLTLRDLFAVLTIVAILVAWWLDHSRLQRRLQAQSYQIRIFSLSSAKSDEIAGVIREMYAGDKDNPLDIASDTRTNAVIVRGPEGMLSEVEATLMRLDQGE
jgi:hypothetical protein